MTPAELIVNARRQVDRAYRLLGDAEDCLAHAGSPTLTREQLEERRLMRESIAEAKEAINRGKS